MNDIDPVDLGADIPLSAPDTPFGEGGLAGSSLDLPAAQTTSAPADPVLAQLEAWLDVILVERAARDTRE
jgi:hypothetical protein